MSFDEEPDGDPHGECALEIHSLQDEIARLRAELEAAKADAERYRWMRSEHAKPSGECTLLIEIDGCCIRCTLDAAIDAAQEGK